MSSDDQDLKAAEEWVERNMSWDKYECDWDGAGEQTFLAGIAHERAKHRWISVRERLPEVGELVILCDSYMGYWWGNANQCGDFVYRFGREEVTSPGNIFTHWMPLPDAPKEEN